MLILLLFHAFTSGQDFSEFAFINRLRNVSIHSGSQAFMYTFGRNLRRHGIYTHRFCIRSLQCPYTTGCFSAAHNRLHNIHQNQIKSSSEFLLSLINYVLETARIESGKTSLKKEVRCASRLIESFINIIFPVKRNLPDIYGDLTTCRSIFQ